MANEKFCFYARYYSEKTKNEQMNTMLKFIEDNDIAIKNTFYFEDYAKNSMDKREGLQQVLKLAYEGQFDRLIILIPQILHIDYHEFERIQDELENYGVKIIKLAGEDTVIGV